MRYVGGGVARRYAAASGGLCRAKGRGRPTATTANCAEAMGGTGLGVTASPKVCCRAMAAYAPLLRGSRGGAVPSQVGRRRGGKGPA